MERLELSKQKLLGPKSSASANFATPVFFFELFYLLYWIRDLILVYLKFFDGLNMETYAFHISIEYKTYYISLILFLYLIYN